MKESFPIPPAEEKPESPSRRKFLKALGAGAATAVAGPFLADRGEKLYGETLGREELEKRLASLRERLRQERGMEIDFSSAFQTEQEHLGLSGNSVEYLTEKSEICEALLDALDLYPPFLHRDAGVSVVRVMNDMRRDDAEDGKRNQDIAGLAERGSDTIHAEFMERHPDAAIDQLFVAVGDVFPSREAKKEKFQSTIHHELEHFTEHDAGIDSRKYSEATRGFWYDRNFDFSCAYDFEIEYLVKEGKMSQQVAEKMSNNYYGFANRYGKTNFWEDRATIAQDLLGSQDKRKQLLERTEKDPVLRKKVDFMKRHYFEKSRGLMDGMYWNLLEKPDNDHRTMAEYLKLRAGIIGKMNDEAFADHIRGTLGKDFDFDAKAWKAEVSAFVGTAKSSG